MKRTQTKYNQKGFSPIYVVLALVVTGIVGFTGGVVYRTHQQVNRNANQAANLPDTIQTADSKKIVLEEAPKPVEQPTEEKKTEPAPAPTTEKKAQAPDTKKEVKPSYTTVSIDSTNAVVTADAVVLTANLPGSYSGNCTALVKQEGGVNAQWYEAPFSSATTCSVSIDRSKFPASGNWYFYMYFKNSEHTVKGQSSSNSFVL